MADYLTRMDFIILMTMLGIISLIGVVVTLTVAWLTNYLVSPRDSKPRL